MDDYDEIFDAALRTLDIDPLFATDEIINEYTNVIFFPITVFERDLTLSESKHKFFPMRKDNVIYGYFN